MGAASEQQHLQLQRRWTVFTRFRSLILLQRFEKAVYLFNSETSMR